MNQHIGQFALVVDDYDRAIDYYTNVLGFELIEDTPLSDVKRWVVVSPKGTGGCNILLAKASNDVQRAAIGNQTGGRVFLFLYTDDIDRDYTMYRDRGVEFVRPLEEHAYGRVTVFSDLYGNLWDLIQPAE